MATTSRFETLAPGMRAKIDPACRMKTDDEQVFAALLQELSQMGYRMEMPSSVRRPSGFPDRGDRCYLRH
ncbi:MAG: hypothetical protein ABID87_08075 [Chloroflexota bacterium]